MAAQPTPAAPIPAPVPDRVRARRLSAVPDRVRATRTHAHAWDMETAQAFHSTWSLIASLATDERTRARALGERHRWLLLADQPAAEPVVEAPAPEVAEPPVQFVAPVIEASQPELQDVAPLLEQQSPPPPPAAEPVAYVAPVVEPLAELLPPPPPPFAAPVAWPGAEAATPADGAPALPALIAEPVLEPANVAFDVASYTRDQVDSTFAELHAA